MLEKRKLKRCHLIYYLRVFNKNTQELLGHLVDVHTEGMMLLSETPIETPANFQLQMILPEEILGTQTWNFEAQSKWCGLDANPQFYKTGFQFLYAFPHDIELIENLIEDYGFRG